MKRIIPLLLLGISSPAFAAGQLPTNVAPISYDIRITPDAKAMTFAGTEAITVDVREATRTITLNAADLTITTATFDGAKVAVAQDAELQQLTVTLPKAATKGVHELRFAWSGKINQSPLGLFAIDYKNQDGSASRMLATQFEAPDARRFAPIWDEPSFKATFKLSAVAPAGQLAFSNMPATSVTKQADGTQVYSFDVSPKMSSYLMFLGMGDMERHTVMAGKTEIGIISRRGVGAQGDYALGAAKRLLDYYNDYFGTPYPLPKMDMIAGPGSSQTFGAMENWGAIFYFENELLFDPARATESNRQRIYTVVAHEMAHQWFGDLVTMAWWDDLWLNEGFASWMENKASTDLNPNWNGAATAVSFDREAALAADATAATHPIIRPIKTVDQIGEAFDGITYQKGQAVIGMMESTLGPDVFRDGIRRYMAKYKYGNTVTEQLWAELSAAAGKRVADIAHDFTLQPGVPLVTLTGATCSGGMTKATLTQGRFGLDAASKQPLTWRVPLRLGVLGQAESDMTVRGAAPTVVTLKDCGTIVLNQGKGSYLRARYDAAGHAAIVRDFTRLPLRDQLGTLGDDFALALSGDQDLSAYLALLDKVEVGADPIEWAMVAGQVGHIADRFEGTPLGDTLARRNAALLAPVMKRVGYRAKAGESPLVSNLRETLIGTLGATGDAEIMAMARTYVAALRTDTNAIPPAIRTPIITTYALNASPAEWDALLQIALAEKNPVGRNAYIRALGITKDDALAKRALDLIKTDRITAPQKASLLRAVAGQHPDMAFDFAVANFALVDSFTEASARSNYVPGLGAGSNDPAMPAKITAFAAKNLPVDARGGAARVVAGMAARREVTERLRPAVTAWEAGG
ncbi:M1 family metallopeptidase [Sphingomonas aliaeris]|uniref:Aminopeptidase n=1 Tax=Sphingomonas aliaeris TaxID=2759526 RepID=A0A974NSY8_9SPHN|nr:M1 family metallopeptidase [Sphingomonas aliaeris]QQV76222.1 M1 family metallopeptidase [Sphingomonas aliaeris]